MSKRKKYLTCSRKYDMPLFCASWTTPAAAVFSEPQVKSEDEARKSDDVVKDVRENLGIGHVVIGGGGGHPRNGVKNRLVLVQYEFATDVLSEAIHTLYTDKEPSFQPAYRLAVHPGSHEIVCSISSDCRLYELKNNGELQLEAGDQVPQPFQGVGEQNCLIFSGDGTRFAMGGDDGHLRVFDWPSLKLVLDEASAHKSIKDLDFSLDSSWLASTDSNGPCRIWDLSKESVIASFTDKGGDFAFCRFSRDDTKSLLYITMRQAGKGVISYWDTRTWEKLGVKKFFDQPISAFSASCDGRYLAIGSTEGDVKIIDAKRMVVTQQIKNAHMVFVTAMDFSPNSRALLSVSGDSSARITGMEEATKKEGWQGYLLMLVLLLVSIWALFIAQEDGQEHTSLEALVYKFLARCNSSLWT